jgi:hypothetical protein
MLSLIESGANLKQLLEYKPGYFLRYHSGLGKALGLQGGPRRDAITCKLYIGPTGTGKSHRAFDELPGAYVWDGTKWWDNYDGQSDVIVDDFCDETDRKGMVTMNTLLRILDKYPCQVQVKGGYRWLKAVNFIFTSNVEIDEWYPGISSVRLEALKRRITVHRMMVPYGEQEEEPMATLDPEWESEDIFI